MFSLKRGSLCVRERERRTRLGHFFSVSALLSLPMYMPIFLYSSPPSLPLHLLFLSTFSYALFSCSRLSSLSPPLALPLISVLFYTSFVSFPSALCSPSLFLSLSSDVLPLSLFPLVPETTLDVNVNHVDYLVAQADGVAVKAAQERRRQQHSIRQKMAARKQKEAVLVEAEEGDAKLEAALAEGGHGGELLRSQKKGGREMGEKVEVSGS